MSESGPSATPNGKAPGSLPGTLGRLQVGTRSSARDIASLPSEDGGWQVAIHPTPANGEIVTPSESHGSTAHP